MYVLGNNFPVMTTLILPLTLTIPVIAIDNVCIIKKQSSWTKQQKKISKLSPSWRDTKKSTASDYESSQSEWIQGEVMWKCHEQPKYVTC